MPPPQPHRLALVERTTAAELDDWNHPVPDDPVTTLLPGFLYPASSREQDQANQAGALTSDFSVVFYPIRPIPSSGYIRFDPDDGIRYEIEGVRPHDFGRHPLVVVDVRRVDPQAPEAGS